MGCLYLNGCLCVLLEQRGALRRHWLPEAKDICDEAVLQSGSICNQMPEMPGQQT